MKSPVLDVGHRSFSDTDGNIIVPVTNLPIDSISDRTPPVISGNPVFDLATGVLTITFDEAINVSAILPPLHIRESGTTSGGVTLLRDELNPIEDDGPTVQFTVDVPKRQAIAAMGTPVLDVGVSVFHDRSDNPIEAVTVPLNVIGRDVTPPVISGTPELNETTGVLVITFDKAIDIDFLLESGFQIRELDSATGGVTLSSSELDTTADGTVIHFTLSETNLRKVIALTTPRLTIMENSVSDFKGNGIKAVDNLHLNITGADTVSPVILGMPTLNENRGLLTILFDELIDIDTILESGFHIRESGTASGGTTLSGDNLLTTSGGTTVKFILEDPGSQEVIALNTPALYIDAGSIRDISGNGIEAINDHELDVMPYDDTPPALSDTDNPILNITTGTLTITFDEDIYVSKTLGFLIRIGESGTASDDIRLSNDELFTTNNGTIIQFDLEVSKVSKIVDMDSPVLKMGAFAIRDFSNNGIEAVDNQELNITENDTTPPAISGTPELNETTGVLSINISKTIYIDSLVGPGFHIHEFGSATDGITLSNDELDTTSDGTTIQFTLNEPNRKKVIGLKTPRLTITENSVFDHSGNGIKGIDNQILVIMDSDTMSPLLSDTHDPTLNTDTGILTITFSEDIDISRTLAFFIQIRESGTASGGVSLSNAELITPNEQDGTTIQFQIGLSKLSDVRAMETPTLNILRSAIVDLSSNGIKAVDNRELDVV